MRVVFNQWAASGRRTGVGHHAAELMRQLPRCAGGDEICFFPPDWVVRYHSLWGRLSNGQPAPPAGTGRGQPVSPLRWARGLLRRCARAVNAWHFQRFCTRRGIDLYHEPNHIAYPCDLPTVSTICDLSAVLHPEWHPADRVAYYQRRFEETVRRCCHFLTISDFVRQEVIEVFGIPPERVTRVYCGIRRHLTPLPTAQVQAALRRLGLPERYLLHVGTIEPRKNLLLLLRAYCALPAALRERWPLLLVGGWGWDVGPVRDYWQAEARHRGVRHVGYVPDGDLAAIYNGARALLCASFYEGFGLPPVEMLACGGAVLCSTAAALVETAGPCAHLVDPRDADGWRAAMRRVVEDDDWWLSLRRGAVAATRPFNSERAAVETWAAYRRALGMAGEASPPLPCAA
jgi:alpha-1,3-rhamnosyl/mannosyltransferase